MTKQVYDAEFERKIGEYFDATLPDKIFDAHVHIMREFAKQTGYNGETYDQFCEFNRKYIRRDLAGAMVMPQVSSKHTEETLNDDNRYNLKLTKKHNHSAGLIIRPGCGRDKAEKLLDENPQIKVLKPYLVYAEGVENVEEADISTFATEWMWELANDREMPLLLHLSHFVDGLSHPANVAEIKHFCKKYPRVKLVLAHCAMGHNIPKLKWGLEEIKGLDNIWFDSSGAGEALASIYCIKYFGVDKLMYGGDFEFATIFGRIVSYGSTFKAVRPTEELDKNSFYRPLNNGQETLLSLLQAMEVLELSNTDREKIFYNNAAEIYG
ncbi:MAG: amidohydrolase family protein [Clostridia bacterium]|nr:amidohydrolase family protein [Clostridia bacterium]